VFFLLKRKHDLQLEATGWRARRVERLGLVITYSAYVMRAGGGSCPVRKVFNHVECLCNVGAAGLAPVRGRASKSAREWIAQLPSLAFSLSFQLLTPTSPMEMCDYWTRNRWANAIILEIERVVYIQFTIDNDTARSQFSVAKPQTSEVFKSPNLPMLSLDLNEYDCK